MNKARVHVVYIIPSDKENIAESQISKAAKHLQSWYRWQMGNGKTFTLTNPVVQVCHSEHEANWYSTFTEDPNTPHSEWYWANAQRDARDLAGAGFFQPNDTWAIYLDADTAPGQHAGGAGVNGSGLCVLTGEDVRAITGQHPTWTLCREIGGFGHELGHTFGLPHPPPGPEFSRAIMGTGYGSYPNAILTENDKFTLDHNQFFGIRPKLPAPAGLCPFDQRPMPLPRPRPIPHIR